MCLNNSPAHTKNARKFAFVRIRVHLRPCICACIRVSVLASVHLRLRPCIRACISASVSASMHCVCVCASAFTSVRIRLRPSAPHTWNFVHQGLGNYLRYCYLKFYHELEISYAPNLSEQGFECKPTRLCVYLHLPVTVRVRLCPGVCVRVRACPCVRRCFACL